MPADLVTDAVGMAARTAAAAPMGNHALGQKTLIASTLGRTPAGRTDCLGRWEGPRVWWDNAGTESLSSTFGMSNTIGTQLRTPG
jgi:hypothetical protein